jgi:hypothetical protein
MERVNGICSSSTSSSFHPPKKIFASASEKTANVGNNGANVNLNVELMGEPEKLAMLPMAEQALLPESSQDSYLNATNGKMEDKVMDSTEVQAARDTNLRSAVAEDLGAFCSSPPPGTAATMAPDVKYMVVSTPPPGKLSIKDSLNSRTAPYTLSSDAGPNTDSSSASSAETRTT